MTPEECAELIASRAVEYIAARDAARRRNAEWQAADSPSDRVPEANARNAERRFAVARDRLRDILEDQWNAQHAAELAATAQD